MHEFTAELWLHDGDAPWVFATLPEDVADAILESVPKPGGFGSVRVEVTIGTVVWRTSVFPDKKRGTFVLPVKREVREAAAVDVGDAVPIRVRPLVDG